MTTMIATTTTIIIMIIIAIIIIMIITMMTMTITIIITTITITMMMTMMTMTMIMMTMTMTMKMKMIMIMIMIMTIIIIMILIDQVVTCSVALNHPHNQWACFRMLGGPNHDAQGIVEYAPNGGEVELSGSPYLVPLLHVKRIKREALAHQIRNGVMKRVCQMAEVGSVGFGNTMRECVPASWVPRWSQENQHMKSSQRPAKVQLEGVQEMQLG